MMPLPHEALAAQLGHDIVAGGSRKPIDSIVANKSRLQCRQFLQRAWLIRRLLCHPQKSRDAGQTVADDQSSLNSMSGRDSLE
jgi:hypothetical protein